MNFLRRFCTDIRYEEGRWPLYRWDKNLRYVAKSLLHRPQPHSAEDARYFEKAFQYLAQHARQIPNPQNPPLLRLAAVGDMMWIRSGYKHAFSPGIRSRLSRADIVFSNLETPIDPARPTPRWVYETFHYNAPPSYLEAWENTASRRVFSLCNNHAIDQGLDGLERTRKSVLERAGNLCVGGLSPEDAFALLEWKGARIGILASSYDINHLQGPPPAGIPLIRFGQPKSPPDWKKIGQMIDKVRGLGADLVVWMPHWGFEYEYWPDAMVRDHAHRLIERGVDIILGTSPHVLEPVELVSIDGGDPACPTQLKRGGPPRMGMIAYSLGNFLSIMPTLACRTGIILELDLERDKAGFLYTANIRAQPTVCGQGMGEGREWLDAGVCTAEELPPSKAKAHWAHAVHLLGELVEKARSQE